MEICDIMTFYYPEYYIEYLSKRQLYPYWDSKNNCLKLSEKCVVDNQIFLEKMRESIPIRLKKMDENNIDKAIIGFGQGIQMIHDEDRQSFVQQVSIINKQLYDEIKTYSNRLYGLAMIQTLDIEHAVFELEHCVKKYNFIGCQIFSDYHGVTPDAKKLWPIYQKACELNIPIFFSGVIPQMDQVLGLGFQMQMLGSINDAAIALARVIASGLLDYFPDLKIIVNNMGELLPIVLERIEYAMTCRNGTKEPAINRYSFKYYFKKNIWLTLSGCCSEKLLKCVCDIVGVDRILFSSNYPLHEMDEAVNFITNNVALSRDEKEKIQFLNGREIFS